MCNRPFANAWEYLLWDEANCARCARLETGCELADALSIAAITDGLIDVAIARRLGATDDDPRICLRCPEFEQE